METTSEKSEGNGQEKTIDVNLTITAQPRPSIPLPEKFRETEARNNFIKKYVTSTIEKNHLLSPFFDFFINGSVVPIKAQLWINCLTVLIFVLSFIISFSNYSKFFWKNFYSGYNIQNLILIPFIADPNYAPRNVPTSASLYVEIVSFIIHIWGYYVLIFYQVRKFLPFMVQYIYDLYCDFFVVISYFMSIVNGITYFAAYANCTEEKKFMFLISPILVLITLPNIILCLFRVSFNMRVHGFVNICTNPKRHFSVYMILGSLLIMRFLYLFTDFDNKLSHCLITVMFIALSAFAQYYNTFKIVYISIKVRVVINTLFSSFLWSGILTLISIFWEDSNPYYCLIIQIFLTLLSMIGYIFYNVAIRNKARAFASSLNVDSPLLTADNVINYLSFLNYKEIMDVLTTEITATLFKRFPIDYDLQIFILRYIVGDERSITASRARIYRLLQRNSNSFFDVTQLLILLEFLLENTGGDISTHKKRTISRLSNSAASAHLSFWTAILNDDIVKVGQSLNWMIQAVQDAMDVFKQLGVSQHSDDMYGLAYVNFAINMCAKPEAVANIKVRLVPPGCGAIPWFTSDNSSLSGSVLSTHAEAFNHITLHNRRHLVSQEVLDMSESALNTAVSYPRAEHTAFLIVGTVGALCAASLVVIFIAYLIYFQGSPNEFREHVDLHDSIFNATSSIFWYSYMNTTMFSQAGILDVKAMNDTIYYFKEVMRRSGMVKKKTFDAASNLVDSLELLFPYVPKHDFDYLSELPEMSNVTNKLTDYVTLVLADESEIYNKMCSNSAFFISILQAFRIGFYIVFIVAIITLLFVAPRMREKMISIYKLCITVDKPDAASIIKIMGEYRDLNGNGPKTDGLGNRLQLHTQWLLVTLLSAFVMYVVTVLYIELMIVYINGSVEYHQNTVSASIFNPLQQALLYQFGLCQYGNRSEEYREWIVYALKHLHSIVTQTERPIYLAPLGQKKWNTTDLNVKLLSPRFLEMEPINISNEAFSIIHMTTQVMLENLELLDDESLKMIYGQFLILNKLAHNPYNYTQAVLRTFSWNVASTYFIEIALLIFYIFIVALCVFTIQRYLRSSLSGLVLVLRILSLLPYKSSIYQQGVCIIPDGYESDNAPILENFPHGIIKYDQHGVVKYVNAEAFHMLGINEGANINDISLTTHIDDNGQTRHYSVTPIPIAKFPRHPFDEAERNMTAIVLRDVTDETLMRARIKSLEKQKMELRSAALPANSWKLELVSGDSTVLLENISIVDIAIPSERDFDSTIEQILSFTDQFVTFYLSDVQRFSTCFVFSTANVSSHQRQYLRDALLFAKKVAEYFHDVRMSIVGAEKVYGRVRDSETVCVKLYSDAFVKASALLALALPGELIAEFRILRSITEVDTRRRRTGISVICGDEVEYCVLENGVQYQESNLLSTYITGELAEFTSEDLT